MRRIPNCLRLVRLVGGALAISVVLSTTLVAQTGSAKKSAPVPPDTSPLSRYAPRENLLVYAEFSGLDSHQDEWVQTAAYKMLNETTLGVMLEDVGAQLADRFLKTAPDRRLNGSEVVKLLKHLTQSGFVFGMAGAPDHAAKGTSFLVLRGAARKEVRPIFSRLLLMIGGSIAKPELSKKRASGRQFVIMKTAVPGVQWAWWAEKDDVVIALNGPESADLLAEVLDGKRPNAVENPIRSQLEKPEDGVVPVGFGFIDPVAVNGHNSKVSAFLEQVRQIGISRFDYRCGFAGDALVAVSRFRTPQPRKGLLALLDQPTFDKNTLLAMPEGVTAFTAFSVEPDKAYETITSSMKSMNPAAFDLIDKAVDSLRTKTRLQLRKDILAHLGPKAVLYTSPVTSAPASRTTLGEGGTASFNPLSLLIGAAAVPKFVLMVQTDNQDAFERSLDVLVIQLNKEIRALVQAKAAEAEAAAAAAAPKDSGESGEEPTRRRRSESPAAPEFKMMPGVGKSYVLNVPSEMGRLPAGFRPTIRVGSKHVVFASSPDAARQALEVKKDAAWIPADEFAKALEAAPEKLVYLQLDDPREQMPKLLASFPGEVQKRINSMLILPPLQTTAPAGAPGAEPGAIGSGGPDPAAAAAEPGIVNPPGIPPGAPAGPSAETAAKPAETALVLRIDSAKLPSEPALKALMFPGTTSAAVNDEEVRIERRVAFPSLIAPDSIGRKMAMTMIKPALQNAMASLVSAAAKRVVAPGTPAESTETPAANSQ